MSIFGTIMSAIFGRASSAQASGVSTASTAQASPAPHPANASAPAPAGAPVPAQSIDVAAVLNDLAKKNKEKLNWRTSIVDLMKLLELDSSLAARKQLAAELHYSGDTNDSATMNIWLHKQVMTKLAENGGKVPADLRH